MKTRFALLLLSISLLRITSTQAQEGFEFPQPTAEHDWLKQFEGTWTTASKATAGPDQPPFECTGTITSEMLGGFWVRNEMRGKVGEMNMHGAQTIGYDSERQKYIGTWVDNTNGHMWRYTGSVDDSGKVLTLQAEGPSMIAPGTTAQFQDIYEFKSADEMVITSKMQTPDGEWVTFMTGTARRTKAE
ncbi:MAG: DUF1579 domain-containing protein [Planctomycetaceae bacterium]